MHKEAAKDSAKLVGVMLAGMVGTAALLGTGWLVLEIFGMHGYIVFGVLFLALLLVFFFVERYKERVKYYEEYKERRENR